MQPTVITLGNKVENLCFLSGASQPASGAAAESHRDAAAREEDYPPVALSSSAPLANEPSLCSPECNSHCRLAGDGQSSINSLVTVYC